MEARIEVVAHRGASGHAPEHTYAAYDLALEMGADALELDVRATADGRLVVVHDGSLARTTGDPREVAGVRFADLPAGRAPLTLDEVLDRYRDATRWLVEIKEPHPDIEVAVARAIGRRGLERWATIQSFDHSALRRLRRIAPGLEVAPLFCETATPAEILASIPRAGRYAAAVGVFHTRCTPAVMRAAWSRGLRIRAYTVNDALDVSRLIRLGADGLITDFPDRVRAALAASEVAAAA